MLTCSLHSDRWVLQVLLAGCSSGGLAVILHCDQLRAFFPSGSTVVKCISDGGLYLDACVPVRCALNLPSFRARSLRVGMQCN